MEETMALTKTCKEGSRMNCWEEFFIHTHQQQDVLIDEQNVNDLNPIYVLANITRWYQDHVSCTSLSYRARNFTFQGKPITW